MTTTNTTTGAAQETDRKATLRFSMTIDTRVPGDVPLANYLSGLPRSRRGSEMIRLLKAGLEASQA